VLGVAYVFSSGTYLKHILCANYSVFPGREDNEFVLLGLTHGGSAASSFSRFVIIFAIVICF